MIDFMGMLRTAARDKDLGFHITASWADVQRKAKRIRAEGGVTIVVASADGIGGTVQGDHGTYEALLVYRPGTRKVADWTCGCAWSSFAFDRSPAFKRFEGRQCSHALALQYEAQSQGMFGKEIHPAEQPPGRVIVRYDPDSGENVYARPYHGSLVASLVAQLREEDADPADVIGHLMRAGMGHKAAVRLWKTAYPREDAGPLLPVKHAGYKGYVDAYDGHHDEMEDQDRHLDGHEDHDDFDEDLYEEHRPEPHPHEQAHYEEHDDYPDSYYERHDEAYAKAKQARDDAVRPVGHHTPLINFIQSHGQNHEFWNRHAALEDVDHEKHGVYATQPYVTQRHLDRYMHNRDDQVAHVHQFGGSAENDAYPGTHHPMMVRHEGNLFAIEGHHRTASDILSGRKTKAFVYDADKHGFPEPDEDDPGYEVEHHGLHKYAAKQADCDYRIENPKQAREHALRHHDDGVCTATERRRARKGGGKTSAKQEELSGPTVSGIALKAHDTGRVLMLQRGQEDGDPASGRWEFPGGHHEPGDQTSLHAGIREFEEEVGQHFPDGGVVKHTWTSPNGVYQGHLVMIPSEKDLSMKDGRVVPNPDDPKGDNHEQAAWWEIEHAKKNPALRDEVKAHTPWKEIAKASLDSKTASAWDPISNTNPQPGRGTNQPEHSNTTNPASTGWAASEDPDNWDNLNGSINGPMTPSLGYDAVLHEHPEPALPTTYGDEDATMRPAEMTHDDLDPVPDNPPQPAYLVPDEDSSIHMLEDGTATPNTYHGSTTRIAQIVADFQRSAAAQQLIVPTEGDDEIASAARAHLEKSGAAKFGFEEQQALINEAPDARARNFDQLQIEGTHYALLDKILANQEADSGDLFI